MSRTFFRCAVGAGLLFALAAPLSATPPQSLMWGDPATPNLFNSIALPIPHSPYDFRGRHAWKGGRGPISTTAGDGAERASFRHLAIVHRDINRRLAYRADPSGSRAGDIWSTAAATLARGSGDCEDFAIAKAQELLALGLRPQDLYLVIGHDLSSRTAHAILVVRSARKFWVLDNLSAEIVDADLFLDFSPVMTLSTDRKWLHGYRTGARAARSCEGWSPSPPAGKPPRFRQTGAARPSATALNRRISRTRPRIR